VEMIALDLAQKVLPFILMEYLFCRSICWDKCQLVLKKGVNGTKT